MKCVVTPLFSAFGPEPIATRMEIGDARVLVTTETLYRRKVEAQRGSLPKLHSVVLVDADQDGEGTRSWRKLMQAASDAFEIPRPIRKRRRCCILQAARPAVPRASYMCTKP